MIVQHFIGAVAPPSLQSFCKFTFNGKHDFSKKDFRLVGFINAKLSTELPT
jgi:hypothetical protein